MSHFHNFVCQHTVSPYDLCLQLLHHCYSEAQRFSVTLSDMIWTKGKSRNLILAPYICPQQKAAELTGVENPLCCFVLQVSVEDDFCLPLVCDDVGLSHDLCHRQVVLDGFGRGGAGHRRQKLLVLLVSKIWLWDLNISDTERGELKRLEYLQVNEYSSNIRDSVSIYSEITLSK